MPEDKDDGTDLTKQIDSIEERLVQKMGETMNGMEDRIAEKVRPTKEPESQSFSWLDDDTDDDDDEEKDEKKNKTSEFVSKKDIKGIVSQVAAEVTKATEEKMKVTSKKHQKDVQAAMEFPEMVATTPTGAPNPLYNKKFADHVGKEMENRLRSGSRTSQDVDLLYDAAASAAARGAREGWYNPRERVVRQNFKRNAGEDNFDVSPRGSDPTEVTQDHLQVGSKMGLSGERVSQLLKIREKHQN